MVLPGLLAFDRFFFVFFVFFVRLLPISSLLSFFFFFFFLLLLLVFFAFLDPVAAADFREDRRLRPVSFFDVDKVARRRRIPFLVDFRDPLRRFGLGDRARFDRDFFLRRPLLRFPDRFRPRLDFPWVRREPRSPLPSPDRSGTLVTTSAPSWVTPVKAPR